MKPMPLINEILLWLWISLILWWSSYSGQRSIIKSSMQHKELWIQVPGWVALLCGRPSPDNRMEIGRMIAQLGALVMSVLWIPLILVKIDYQKRMDIFTICFLSNLVIGGLVTLIAPLFRTQ